MYKDYPMRKKPNFDLCLSLSICDSLINCVEGGNWADLEEKRKKKQNRLFILHKKVKSMFLHLPRIHLAFLCVFEGVKESSLQ